MTGRRDLFRLGSALRRPSSSSSEEELPPPSANRVKRALFGPTDHDENIRFVENELKKARNEASSRWNFDFDSGKPLQGNYDWEEVPISCTTADKAIINPHKHSTLTSDDVKENTQENIVSSAVSEEAAARLQAPESLLSTSSQHSETDLKTPPQSSSDPSSHSSLQLGAIPKTKEIKMTDVYRNRKRSKSSSRLKLKRLGGDGAATRSPSVSSRVNLKEASVTLLDEQKASKETSSMSSSSSTVPSVSSRESSAPSKSTISARDDGSSNSD